MFVKNIDVRGVAGESTADRFWDSFGNLRVGGLKMCVCRLVCHYLFCWVRMCN